MDENTTVEISTNPVELEKRDNFVTSSIDFLQTLIEYQGRDVAMEAWEEIFERLPVIKDVKHEVLLKMLTGDIRKVAVRLDSTSLNNRTFQKVNAIKAYREATGVGLKEAKDVLDEVEKRDKIMVDIPDRHKRANFVRNLQAAGYLVK